MLFFVQDRPDFRLHLRILQASVGLRYIELHRVLRCRDRVEAGCVGFLAALEAAVAGQVLQEDLAVGLVFVPDEAQPEEEAAEGVLLIFDRLLFRGDALWFLAISHRAVMKFP